MNYAFNETKSAVPGNALSILSVFCLYIRRLHSCCNLTYMCVHACIKIFLKICIILSPNLLKNVAFSRNSTIANQFSFQLFFKNGSINQSLALTLF